MATSEIILIENIPGLGAEADVVKVKAGFARNFLVPHGKAYFVTAESLRKLNQLKAKRAEREGRELNEAEELGRRINKLKLVFTLETGETGKAFGSVTAKDIAERIQSELKLPDFERSRIQLDRAIKDTGAHEVPVKLHADVSARVNVTVKPKAEPAPEPAEAEQAAEKKTPARTRK